MTLVGHRVFVAREDGRYRVYLAADRSEGGALQPCHAVLAEDGSLVWVDHPQGGCMEPLEVTLFGNVQAGGEVVGNLFPRGPWETWVPPGWRLAEGGGDEILREFVNDAGERHRARITASALCVTYYGGDLVKDVEQDMAHRGFSPVETPDA